MQLLLFVAIFHLYYAEALANDDLILSIRDGLIKGSFRESYDGRKFIAFEGIPFARPPLGNLRFEDPQPVEPWSGVLDALNTYKCLQLDLMLKFAGQEDCLYLNVYVPREKINPNERLDVIAHIHGSGFMQESAILAGPNKLMDRDVIYVNFNYRLGPFGFYSLGDGRGNYGLKDQVAALKWIQSNIEKFGGNKDSVTLSGMSAGGASVHLQYFSELSEGLFHKGFAQSGMALNPWAIKVNPAGNGKKLADLVGCTDEDVQKIYECMKQRSGQQITEAIKYFYYMSIVPMVPFGPVVENDSPTSFLKKLPYAQLVDKEVIDVPLIISMTTEEGTAPAAFTYGLIDEINDDWNKWLPILLEYYQYDQEKRDEVSAKIKQFYFENEPLTPDNYHRLIKACSHRMFLLGAEKGAKLHANAVQSNVYFYLFKYVSDIVPSMDGTEPVDFGAGHGADLKYYYTGPYDYPVSKNEEKLKEALLDMFVSFAETGNPNTDAINFEPVSKTGELNYLLISDPADLHMEAGSIGPHEFWNSLGLKQDADAINEV